MKRFPKVFISVFAIAFTLVSCNKDNPLATDPVTGNWILDNIVIMLPKTDPQIIDVNGDCTNKNYFDLNSGGIFNKADIDPATCELTLSDGKWKITNNSLEITSDGETITFNITSVTASKLVLKVTDLGSDFPAGSYAVLNFTKNK